MAKQRKSETHKPVQAKDAAHRPKLLPKISKEKAMTNFIRVALTEEQFRRLVSGEEVILEDLLPGTQAIHLSLGDDVDPKAVKAAEKVEAEKPPILIMK